MKVLSLFSGIGGLDIGASIAGLPPSLAVDIDQAALNILSDAVPCATLCGDISSIDANEVAFSLELSSQDTLVVIGGPPCTGFSHAGFWMEAKRNGSDPATNLLAEFAGFVRELKPRAWVLENVPGLTFKTYKQIYNRFTAAMSDAGYALFEKIIDAAAFGVPQHRRRLFIVGLKGDDVEFRFPEPVLDEHRYRSAAWAFSDFTDANNPPEADEKLSGKYAELLPKVPEGDNYLFFTEKRGHPAPRFKWRSKYWSFLKKLDPEQPSNTVPATRVTNNGPFHWENRHLRISELKRLQGLPDSLQLKGTAEHRRFVGNSVPPLLAAVVIGAVMQQLPELQSRFRRESLDRLLAPDASASEVASLLSDCMGSDEERP